MPIKILTKFDSIDRGYSTSLGLSVMPSAHGPIFYCRQKIRVKISSCVLTFGQI